MPTKKPETKNLPKRLYRSERDRMIGGVAGGLGEYFDLDPVIFRILFVVVTIFGGSGLLLYLILWIVIPSQSHIEASTDDALRSNIEEIKQKAGYFAEKVRNSRNKQTGHSHDWLGAILILLGGLFLLKSFGIPIFVDWGKLWPIILVLLGLSILLRK
jgi:phage shock protein PspC (stress-responsive transcriptional regulator)